MAPIAILFGVLLTLLGGGLYVYTDMKSPTALIPAGFGVVLIVLGIVARNEKARKHAMHGAALVGLIGFAFPAFRVIQALMGGAEMNPAIVGSIIMSLLCLVFLGLCVNSFVAARIARKRKEADALMARQ